tara:strand:+ start:119 stop:538 length:420 start_codon:yes stop_codon:yes gene_type:complete
MAKVSRGMLKEIVKECLLEILFEGIDSESGLEEEPIREARKPVRTSRPSKQRKKKHTKEPGQLRDSVIHSRVSELTADPMMAAIFTDTAKTTLLEQKEGRSGYIPADKAASAVQSVDNMEDLFQGAGNWAALAFNEVEK